ncbi:hypothetical protein ARMSODRAFT_982591 [Armillaria solidipes]|uniref:Uncharacterized protein n=1 Tax=Armillaria solidipes TaxID=1076256 RepID=A0A2H3AYW3_9AGAR|nr:hypothetical protein ARMSODRAFT_982591 [Armillaria solidipes]
MHPSSDQQKVPVKYRAHIASLAVDGFAVESPVSSWFFDRRTISALLIPERTSSIFVPQSDIAQQVIDNKKGYTRSSVEGHDAPKVYQQPTGLRGLYYNPITHVEMLGFVHLMGKDCSRQAMNIHYFVDVAGAILSGPQKGSLMMTYPTATRNGKFLGIFLSIFHISSVVEASVIVGRNRKSAANIVDNGATSDSRPYTHRCSHSNANAES